MEEEAQWTEVVNKKSQRRLGSCADVVRSRHVPPNDNRILTGANSIPLGNRRHSRPSAGQKSVRFDSGPSVSSSNGRRFLIF
jgi:hypothetical protein